MTTCLNGFVVASCVVEHVDISGNPIGDRGALALMAALVKSATLKSLGSRYARVRGYRVRQRLNQAFLLLFTSCAWWMTCSPIKVRV